MARTLASLFAVYLVLATAIFVSYAPMPVTGATDLLPDLRTLSPKQIYIRYAYVCSNNVCTFTGRELRFSNTVWNGGQGPLELRGEYNPASGKTRVWQRIYSTDGSFRERFVGEFVWHAGHNHWHFEKFALYELWSLSSKGSLKNVVVSSHKITFCIADTEKIAQLIGSPSTAVYNTCGNQLQGISVGWGDTYGAGIEGQSLDITNVLDGKYALKSTADPVNRLTESNDNNNAMIIYIKIAKGTVTVLSGP